MSPLKIPSKPCVKANENENLVDMVKLFIQKSRSELHAFSKSISSQRQSDITLSDSPSSSANTSKLDEEETKSIEELPASIAIHNTLRMNASEIEQLLGISYPGHVHSVEDLQVKYTPQQRKQIYDHVVATIPTPEHLKLKALHETADNTKLFLSSKSTSKSSRHHYGSQRPSFNKELRYVIESQMQALNNTIKLVAADNCHKESKTKDVELHQETNQSPIQKNSRTHNGDNKYKSPNKKQECMKSSKKISKDLCTSSNRKQHRPTSPSRHYNDTPRPKWQHHPYSKRKPENQSPMQYSKRHQRWRQNNDYRIRQEI